MGSALSSTDLVDSGRSDSELWEELVWRECQQDAARRLNVPVADVKPCWARIGSVPEGNRNNSSFLYATELRRMGVSESEGWRELLRWNGLCKPPLSELELRNAFESAWRGQKVYGCRGMLATMWCVGRDKCDWFKRNVAGRRKCRETDFFDYGWPALLKSAELRVYLTLARLEQAKGVGAGGMVIEGTRRYAELSGVYRTRVLPVLESLEAHGLLIVFERGQKRQTGLPARACQVKRIVPIPEPPVAQVNRKREALCR